MSLDILGVIVLLITLVLVVIPKVPLAITMTIGALLMMVIGAMTPAEVCGYFGNQVPVLLAASGVVTAAIFETGLASKVGEILVKAKFLTGNEKVFLMVIIIASGVMSIFVANMPVVALFMPLIASVASTSNGRIQKKYSVMAMTFAVSMGGGGALIGATQNLAGQAALQELTGVSMTMFEMLPESLVALLVMLVFYATIGDRLQKKFFTFPEVVDADPGNEAGVEFQAGKAAISGMTFVGMIVLFIAGVWNFGAVALLGAIIVVLTGCISWKKALTKIDWNTVIIIAMCTALATGVNNSGAGALIANALLNLCGGENASPILLLVVAILLSSVLGCFMQHNAIVTMLIPIFCTIALILDINPVPFAVAVIVGSNNCFITPIGTGPITMGMAAGYRFNDYVKVGTPLFILLDIILCIVIPLFHPF